MAVSKSHEGALKRELKLQVGLLAGFVVVFWAVEAVDALVFAGGLDVHGIRPRTAPGLLGILFAPFLHGGLAHLLANTVPFVVLGWLSMMRETWHFLVITAAALVLGGLGTWLVGAAGSTHVGASGLVFGYFGFLLLAGWFERRPGAIFLSILVGLGYGGLVFGVLPGQRGISWEGHLFGFLAGVGCAWLLARRPKRPRGDVG